LIAVVAEAGILKFVSRSPVDETLANWIRVIAFTIVNVHQKIILLSPNNCISYMFPFVLLVLKEVSRAPVEVTLAIRFLADPPILEKPHPTRILPSVCNAISKTVLSAIGLKEVSRAPVEVTLAI